MPKSPDTAADFYRLGADAFKKRRFAEASGLFEKALQVDPAYHRAWVYLGMACQEAGEKDRALKALVRATEIDPAYAKGHHQLGVLLQDRKEYVRAAAAFRLARSADPKSAAHPFRLGLCLIEAGKPREAVEPLEAARQLAPADPEAALACGQALLAAGRVEEAIPALERFLELTPATDRADAVRMRVRALRRDVARTETQRNVRLGAPGTPGKDDLRISALRLNDGSLDPLLDDDPIEAALKEENPAPPPARKRGKTP